MNAQLEHAVQNVEMAMAEFDQKGMISDAKTEQDEQKMYDSLASQCAVRNSCGCKRGAAEPAESLIEERMSVINAFGDPISEIRKSGGCARSIITDLLSRKVDAHTLQLAAQGDAGSKLTTDPVWGELKDFCADALPGTLQEFLRPPGLAEEPAEATTPTVATAAATPEPAAVAPTPQHSFNACGVNRYQTPDGQCADLTVCGSNQYQSVASTSMSDRQCAPLTVCDSNQFQSVAPTRTTDRQCKTIQTPKAVAPVTPVKRSRSGISRLLF